MENEEMRIIIDVDTKDGRTKTSLNVEDCHTDLEKGIAAYLGDVFKAAIDKMYDEAKAMQGCPTCKTIMIGVCPDCGNEIGRIL
jgi:hypothetical protein